VTYVGSSNLAAWDVALAQSAAQVRRFLGLISEQCLYNLARRAVEIELVPALRSLGVGLIAYSPLHAGLLAGALEAVETGAASGDLPQRVQPIRSQLAAYEALCRDTGAKPAHVALAWLLRDPVVSTAVVGARSVAQLHANVAGLALRLEPDVLKRLDHIWPGPGEAPQAYAW
jgi:aryl-alcohol dehydrogenase-like predicted oxidoreductase